MTKRIEVPESVVNLRCYLNKKQGAVSPKRIGQMLNRAGKSIGTETATCYQLLALKVS